MTPFPAKRGLAILFAALVLAAALAWRAALARNVGELEAHFLNVGQGDAIFVELPDGNQILIDGGPDASVLAELSEVMGSWDRTIDVVVATHPEADHIGGLVAVLERYEVAMIVETGIRKDTALSRVWEEAAAREEAKRVIAAGPKRLRFGTIAALDVLWPQESHAGEILEEANETAVVARLAYGETAFLFTGDIERGAEGRLVVSGAPLDADLLKVAHHGSKTSTSEAFLDAVAPEIAVISVGEGNRYGHPHPSVLERLERRGIAVFRTDRDGRVTARSDGRAFDVSY